MLLLRRIRRFDLRSLNSAIKRWAHKLDEYRLRLLALQSPQRRTDARRRAYVPYLKADPPHPLSIAGNGATVPAGVHARYLDRLSLLGRRTRKLGYSAACRFSRAIDVTWLDAAKLDKARSIEIAAL